VGAARAGDRGCGSSPKSDTIRIALNWFPESEHGGFFTAVVNGYYAADHHDVTLVAGGPGVPVIHASRAARWTSAS